MPSHSLPTREEFLEQLSPMPVHVCAIIDEDTACAICIKEPVDMIINEDDELAVLLHDTHCFGEKCAREWLASANTCPKCRCVLFEEDAEMTDSEVESITVRTVFDEEEVERLLYEVVRIVQLDPETEAFSDRELMKVWFDLWGQWMTATGIDDNSEVHGGPWSTYGEASNDASAALDALLHARLRWYQASPDQLNVNITETFDSGEDRWNPSEAELRRAVTIGFDCSEMSAWRLEHLIGKWFLHAFDDQDICFTAAGHPLVFDVWDRLDGLLQNFKGEVLSLDELRNLICEELGDPDELEGHPDLPLGWSDYLRFVIDKTCLYAVRVDEERRAADEALAAAAASIAARRAQRRSTCPRMSAPSSRDQ